MSTVDPAGGGASHPRRRRRTRPGRIILGWLVFYTLAFSVLALAGYDDSLPALRLVVGSLAGYGAGYLASRSPGRAGESVATFLFYAALGVMTIMAVFIVTSSASVISDPWWLASLGFVSGVLAATYVRIKTENPRPRQPD